MPKLTNGKKEILATVRGPLGGRGVPCIHHLNRVCMHGSVGGACRPFFHVSDFTQVVQCDLDKCGKQCIGGHSCAYWHGAECNQGLWGSRRIRYFHIFPAKRHVPGYSEVMRRPCRGRLQLGQGRSDGSEEERMLFFSLWMGPMHEALQYWN